MVPERGFDRDAPDESAPVGNGDSVSRAEHWRGERVLARPLHGLTLGAPTILVAGYPPRDG